MKQLLTLLAMLVVLFAAAVASKFLMEPMRNDLKAQAAPRATPEQPAQTPEKAPVIKAAQKEDAPAMPTVTTTTTTHGGWTVSCTEAGDPAAKACTATFRVFDQKTNQNLLVWVLGRNRDGQLLSEFHTATEVMIQPGVVLTIDDRKPVRADYVECSARGCKARLLLSDEIAEGMKTAGKARIDMTRIDGKVIQFTLDIPGTDLALRDLGA